MTAACGLRLEDVDGGEVTVELVVVEPVTHNEVVRDVESLVGDGNRRDAALLLVEEDAELQRFRSMTLYVVEEERRRQPGVDDVLDHQHIPPGDIHGQVLEQLDVS